MGVVRIFRLSVAVAALSLCACDKIDFAGFVATSSPSVDERFEQSAEWNAANPQRVIDVAADDYRVIVASDLHVGATTESLGTIADEADGVAAVFLLGDLTDNGSAFDAFEAVVAPHANIFSTIGNHDLFFGSWTRFASSFGTSVFTVEVVTPSAKDIYIILDSASGTLGKSQREWLQSVLNRRAQYRHCIVGTHTNIIKSDNSQLTSGNLPLDETYALCTLFADAAVTLCIDGHDHYRSSTAYRGVEYITLDAASDNFATPSYLALQVSDVLTETFVALGNR